jgi:mono/diheme cytochrome c family protein
MLSKAMQSEVRSARVPGHFVAFFANILDFTLQIARMDEGCWMRFVGVNRVFLWAMLALVSTACTSRHDAGPPDSSSSAAAASELIERGRYLARAANCGPCHTRENGPAMAGGVAFDTPFGTIHSANITPDAATGIGSWTVDQFRRSLREGLRPNGEHLYPVFPYTAFTRVSDADATALFAYLTSLPAVRSKAPNNVMSFPFNQRWLLGVWNLLFLDRGPYEPDALKSAEWNRGAYLVTGLAHCSACHSPRNFLGAERGAARMTGGVLMDRVAEGVVRPWSAPNLTSASSGLAAWPVEEIVAYLKTGANSFITTYGPMNEVIMQGTRHLSDVDIHAMAVYLKSLPAQEGRMGSTAGRDSLENGEAVYSVNCGTCHQPDGLGAEDSGPKLAGSLIVQASDPASLINNILYGPKLPDPAPRARGWRKMEPFGEDISDEDIADLASYLRNAWSNRGGMVTAEQVAKQRF